MTRRHGNNAENKRKIGGRMRHGSVRRYYIAVAVMVLIAYLLLVVDEFFDVGYSHLRSLLRLIIQLGLILSWAYSVQIRVIQPKIRRCLAAISLLMVFWLVVRFCKWNCSRTMSGNLMLWYLYYIPIVFIPFLALVSSKIMRQNESQPFPVWVNVLFCVGTVLVLLVLTNNLHSWVFSFEKMISDNIGSYRHEIVYYIILIWDAFCVAETIRTVVKRSHILNGRHRIVLLSVCVLIVIYTVLYLFTPNDGFLHRYIKDMTMVYCLFTMTLFEFCFSSHLIPNNSEYKNLFLASTLNAAIKKPNEEFLIYSSNLHEFSREVLEESKEHPVLADGHYRISSFPVFDGRVYWEEDITELLENIDELEDMKQELSDRNTLAQIELDIEKRKQKAIVLSKIYDRIQKETSVQIKKLYQLTEQFEAEQDEEEKRHILRQVVIIGTYLKRRSNLLLLSESETAIPSSELLLCIQESMNILELAGIKTCIDYSHTGMFSFADATALYDFFELVVEKGIAQAEAMVVHISGTDDCVSMLINIDSENDLSALADFSGGEVETERDDDEWCLRFRPEGAAL